MNKVNCRIPEDKQIVKFKNVAIGQRFEFTSEYPNDVYRTFFGSAVKVSGRQYVYDDGSLKGMECTVGSINADCVVDK